MWKANNFSATQIFNCQKGYFWTTRFDKMDFMENLRGRKFLNFHTVSFCLSDHAQLLQTCLSFLSVVCHLSISSMVPTICHFVQSYRRISVTNSRCGNCVDFLFFAKKYVKLMLLIVLITYLFCCVLFSRNIFQIRTFQKLQSLWFHVKSKWQHWQKISYIFSFCM